MTGSTTSPVGRIAWPDIAKAACIVAVVLFHAVRQHYVTLDWGPSVPVALWWIAFNDLLQPIRMPLFFAISGLMAASSLWRASIWGIAVRALRPLYLYALWAFIFLIFFTFGPQLEQGYAALSMTTRIVLLLYGVNMAWYLWALGAFFLIARLTRSWPLWLVLGGSAALSYASKTAYPENFFWVYGAISRNLPFFLIGARLPALLWALGARSRKSDLPVALIGFAALVGLTDAVDTPVAAMALEVSGIVLGIALAVQVARWPLASKAGQSIGTRTLPIYVLHFPVLATVCALAGPFLTPQLLAKPVFAAVYPLILTAITIAASLIIHRVLLKAGARWLFALPAPVEAFVAAPALPQWLARRKAA